MDTPRRILRNIRVLQYSSRFSNRYLSNRFLCQYNRHRLRFRKLHLYNRPCLNRLLQFLLQFRDNLSPHNRLCSRCLSTKTSQDLMTQRFRSN